MLPLLMVPKNRITWKTWEEDSEATLASDDIFVCFMENTNASGDETGQGGGLSGANLVLTESGTIAGATGTPPTRVLDGVNDYFTMTNAAVDALIGNTDNTWTIILKVSTLTTTNDYFMTFEQTGGDEFLRIYRTNVTGTLGFYTSQDDVAETKTTTNATLADTTYYIAFWTDGTTMRGGFTTTRPTKLSDFDEDELVEFETNTGAFSGETFDAAQYIFAYSSGVSPIACKAYYTIISKTCLIDNNS